MHPDIQHPKFIWLHPFNEVEMQRRAQKRPEKYGGPTPEELGVVLEKERKLKYQHRCHPCVFFDPISEECRAMFFTKNLDIHNGCWNSGMVWVKSE